MLLERVRRAVAPDYEIIAEIAAGGMGLVFTARQVRLDRTVALKILRPEHATAIAVERFLAEGRVLARLTHPNIVPVYDAGEAEGLFYYVMEFVEGETLAQRLTRGPLAATEALRLAQELLAALQAAHLEGVVHRDVKPSNIFLRAGQAFLGDFGIARWREGPGESGLTTPGELVGTPLYMAPEQRDGSPPTARTDLYAAGMVLWEACTGSRWPAYQPPAEADWSRVPSGLAPAVRRALELAPEQRWPDARSFAAGLGARRRSRLPFVLVPVLLLALAWAIWPARAAPPHGGFPLEVGRVATLGTGAAQYRTLGDSIASRIRDVLAGNPLFYVPPAKQTRHDPGAVRLEGSASLSGDTLRLSIQQPSSLASGAERIAASRSGPARDWQSLADSVAAVLVFEVWKRAEADPFFPTAAIPANDRDRAQLAGAEQYFSLGRWEEARIAYQQLDSTCLLCAFRLLDIARWFGWPQDAGRLTLLLQRQASFPEHYRSLIRAAALPPRLRLDTLAQAAEQAPGFFLAAFEQGDELLHRGPLYGHLRAEALAPLRKSLLYRTRFEPASEHLAWLLISEGDSAGAARELTALLSRPVVSELSGGLILLRNLGFHWRFLPPDSARRFSAFVLRRPDVVAYLEASAGARLLMTMDEPRGAVELGALLAQWSPERPDAAVPGLLGQLYGYAALGKPESLQVVARRFGQAGADAGYALLALELEVMLRIFDADSGVARAPELREALAEAERRLAADPPLRRRVLWAEGVLAVQSGAQPEFEAARRKLESDSGAGVLLQLLAAAQMGRNDPARALGLLPRIAELDAETEYADPFEDAVTHLLRASWQQRLNQLAEAARTLRWHEHAQLSGHLTGGPQAGELAWALGTLVRWRRAGILESMGSRDAEYCQVNRGVARLWADGAAPYRARADTARQRLRSAGCAGAR